MRLLRLHVALTAALLVVTAAALAPNSGKALPSRAFVKRGATSLARSPPFYPSRRPLFKSALSAANASEEDDSPSWAFSPLYGTISVLFLSYAFFVAPGSLTGGDGGQAVLDAFIANPAKPEGVNELFLVVFNALGVMPLCISSLLFVQGSKKGLPAAPFALAASFAGFFGLGKDDCQEIKQLSSFISLAIHHSSQTIPVQ
jgi:hypothetical protein